RRPGRVHERREVIDPEGAGGRRALRRGPPLRDVGSGDTGRAPRDGREGARDRYGRLHPQAAAPPGRVVPGDTRGGGRGRRPAPRHRRVAPGVGGTEARRRVRARRPRDRGPAGAPGLQQGGPAHARRGGRAARARRRALPGARRLRVGRRGRRARGAPRAAARTPPRRTPRSRPQDPCGGRRSPRDRLQGGRGARKGRDRKRDPGPGPAARAGARTAASTARDRSERDGMTGRRDRIAIIGPGRMGLALGAALVQADAVERIDFFGRDEGPPPHPIFETGSGRIEYRGPLSRLPDATSAVILAVPDEKLVEVAYGLATFGPAPAGCVALHLAGAISTDVLAPLHAVGYEIGS